MKGLAITLLFLILSACTYVGVLFVEQNRTEVVIHLGAHDTPSTPIGFVVLTSVLIGMFVCGLFCSVELLSLRMQNKKLRRRLSIVPTKQETAPTLSQTADVVTPRASGRFT